MSKELKQLLRIKSIIEDAIGAQQSIEEDVFSDPNALQVLIEEAIAELNDLKRE